MVSEQRPWTSRNVNDGYEGATGEAVRLWTFFVDAESNSGERSRASFYQYRYCERHQEGCHKGIQAHAKA